MMRYNLHIKRLSSARNATLDHLDAALLVCCAARLAEAAESHPDALLALIRA